MKSPVHRTLGHILYELYSYAAAGVLGFYIGCMGAILILFELGLQHPNRQVPVWVNIITWPIYIVPIIFFYGGSLLSCEAKSSHSAEVTQTGSLSVVCSKKGFRILS